MKIPRKVLLFCLWNRKDEVNPISTLLREIAKNKRRNGIREVEVSLVTFMCILSCRKLLKKGKKYHSCMWNRFALSQYYRNLNFQHDILNRAYKSLMFLLVVLIDQM
ncbi:unnamed protein product [Arabidopsis thaliana]|uniref:Uncharacterized protein n=2 Tax=Arabidopsis thaliana TaxID=3702 RepID=A0A654F679_ARATH|nr:uncharacterized protein AT2G41505 [Arabidopsis thaliana]NP_001324963.1 uncharacterized protein AT2G41505 [Arabidopsis thaliana]NP_001324964.1 uncharacterized protein AT2G41505 [Arabidopsis thaliana]ANM62835.1 hypothetical protein AT2G41505 [Arabidopsis thaliana]ANM62836.1 hypothetical protein AT2G41505 [Arabidopsis thaliana]ANM62837.1 hypothetical protein AT2G41505 [Arabidopsis thaliana]CAA0376186.1 unnamed protein product [Arabidopsis thaliana]VYS55192.1 unnamed protein product [Arabidop|eukprot:NP_001324962.1 hypothetical protein AT2G41505 [Arabidopsis thaliana]